MINVCLCSDSNFLKPLEIAVFSILTNAKAEINLHIIKADDFNEDNLVSLASKFDAKMFFYEINIDLPEKGRFSKAMYGRLYMADILPISIEKVIYLDCDIVVNKCISCLWNVDIQGASLGAVPETNSIIKNALIKKHKLSDYFNSGVLIVDLNKARTNSNFTSAINLLQMRGVDFEYPDQDSLNIIFDGDWYKMDLTFNYMNLNVSYDAVVVHYALSKPWDSGFNENSHFYNEYLRLYPYPLPYFKREHKKEPLRTVMIRNLISPFRSIYWNWVK